MSDAGSTERTVLNWRGPLLAAGIFAVAFAALLLMAHRNQSNASDMGSSLREDPYGTSLLFEAYRRAGYQVTRGQDQDSLADLDAPNATAFFIGGTGWGEFKFENGKLRVGGKVLAKLEGFLARGGRVVLVDPQGSLKSETQGWEVRNEWESKKQDSHSRWLAPSAALPTGAESIYLAHRSPWLKTDDAWSALYKEANDDQTGANEGRVYMAKRRVGNGELIVASQQAFC